ncbi:hypothetical protein [Arcobacter cloacae]|uniref:Uncharacterized protein n=1 Tax=Arcobacter cloacae TaxID=1054034 RepID=A0A6M8NSN8_9BACT|nr:hypothetical protein [Arcobacter cloacae]QKF89556.1 hypothetical protein ACLO_1050 [Arcobacter cloacae]RXI42794.1 hypothetical protein CP963_01905 [Arcobacter cloacae]
MKYENSYVAFLDVLGFKKLVFSKSKEDKKKIESYFEIVKSEISSLKTVDTKQDINYILISDSIIISIEQSQDETQKIENLRQLCIAVGKIQCKLALHNIWLRGAISSGETYIDSEEKQIVGAGYINAYLLEANHAIVPRVIIDNKIIYELELDSSDVLINKLNRTQHQYLFQWNWYGNHMIKIEKDIPLFINYFHNIENDDLLMVMNNIQENIYSDVTLYKKFKWVSDYLISYLYHKEKQLGSSMAYHEYIRLLETL